MLVPNLLLSINLLMFLLHVLVLSKLLILLDMSPHFVHNLLIHKMQNYNYFLMLVYILFVFDIIKYLKLQLL